MQQYKVCPTCNTENALNSYMCDVCLADISSIQACQKNMEPERVLELHEENGQFIIDIKNGDCVGRENVGKEVLSMIKTVSRKHASFICENDSWYIEDIGSANSTYINNVKIKSGIPIMVKNGDKVSLSLGFNSIIKI